jgi:hypothetical protein
VSARISRVAAVATIAGFPLAVLASLLLARSAGGQVAAELVDGLALAIPFGAFGMVGALILWRRPGNVVGWVCAAMAILYALGACAIAYAAWGNSSGSPPGTVLAAWLGHWTWYPLVGMALVALPLLIPDGRLVSPRWRWVAWLGVVSVGGMTALAMLQPWLSTFEGEAPMANPMGIPGVPSPLESPAGTALLVGHLIAFAGAVASIVVRYHHARPTERARLKWIVFAFGLTLGVQLTLEVVQRLQLTFEVVQRLVLLLDTSNVVWAGVWMILPVGIGIAVLRHRLFDIDRIVTRTVSYVMVTIVLAGVYVVGVVGLGGLLRVPTGDGGGNLVVAGSTLLVAAAFGPVRCRVQAAVDRRFNRARYDAARVVESFSHVLRDEVDLDRLVTDVRDVAQRTVQPAHASLWLRTPESST